MSPKPEANRESPEREENNGELSMPAEPHLILPAVSDDDDDGEDVMPANAGYQMLSQEPLSDNEDDSDEENTQHMPQQQPVQEDTTQRQPNIQVGNTCSRSF